jgi:N-acetylmuramoyl-L-alanine amidase
VKIAMSSGHGQKVRGASGYIDEVEEARRVVERVADEMHEAGIAVTTFHDNTSTTQDENLETIVNWHNSQDRDYDVSVHFNAYVPTDEPMGTECLYISQADLAATVAAAIAKSGDLINRGPKVRSDLYFLNNTEAPAILIETCFVDSKADVNNYQVNFGMICGAIADVFTEEEAVASDKKLFHTKGTCSWFGGPQDEGVDEDEGLAFIYEYEQAPHLFLKEQPPGTTGLARRLDPAVPYVACRWDYDVTPKEMLANKDLFAVVRAGKWRMLAWPADWGPHETTGRVADLSPGLLETLGLETDDEVEVIYPFRVKQEEV